MDEMVVTPNAFGTLDLPPGSPISHSRPRTPTPDLEANPWLPLAKWIHEVTVQIEDSSDDESIQVPKRKRSCRSCKREIMPPPADEWDTDDIVDIYGSDGVDEEIAEATRLELDQAWSRLLRQVDSSHAPKHSCSCSLLDAYFNARIVRNSYMSCDIPVDSCTQTVTSTTDNIFCSCHHSSDHKKCACDHNIANKKLWILDSGASMHFTPDRKDFDEYHELSHAERIPVRTANGIIFVVERGHVLVQWLDQDP